jgi:hypothetical protein
LIKTPKEAFSANCYIPRSKTILEILTEPLELQVFNLILGMLIDFEVFEVEDILELVNKPALLEERISEANQLID